MNRPQTLLREGPKELMDTPKAAATCGKIIGMVVKGILKTNPITITPRKISQFVDFFIVSIFSPVCHYSTEIYEKIAEYDTFLEEIDVL